MSGTRAPCPDLFNAAAYVLAAAETTPDKEALITVSDLTTAPQSWTYRDLASRVQSTATGLAGLGLGQGDKIILRLGNSQHFPIAFLAALTLGAIPVPTSSQLTTAELDRIVDDLGDAKAIICAEDLDPPTAKLTTLTPADLDDMAELPPRPFLQTRKDAPAYIIYTSGSSGVQKGVVHAHRAIWARRMMWTGWYDLRPSDRMLHAGAFNWTFTLGTGLMDPWAIGATAIVYTGPPDRHIWSQIAHRHAATLFAAAPGVFRQLLTSPRNLSADFSTLRHALSAGEALPETTREAWADRTDTDIYEALGMSEVSTFISGRPGERHIPGTVGKPQPGRRITILTDKEDDETGILAVHKSDPGLMLGYYRRYREAALPLTGDWFATGDRAALNENGTLTYHGRADTLLTVGGFRIAPEEVEKTLISHPDISDAAVAAVAVRQDVRILAAFYTAAAPIEPGELESYMSERMASYKLPRHYQHVTALPRRANGKLARRELSALWRPTS